MRAPREETRDLRPRGDETMRARAVALALVVAVALAGCDEPDVAARSPSPSAQPSARVPPATAPAAPPRAPAVVPAETSKRASGSGTLDGAPDGEDFHEEGAGAANGAPSAAPSGSSEPDDGAESGGPCAPRDPTLKPLQLLSFTFTSRIAERMPTDAMQVARPGKRVWVHMRLRNRSGEGRCVHVEFRVNGKKRTEVELDVGESWNWRTYAFVTLRDTDTSGIVEARVLDDQGAVVVERKIGILPPAAPKK